MLTTCAEKDEPGSYEEMIIDWSIELHSPPSWAHIHHPDMQSNYTPSPIQLSPVTPSVPPIVLPHAIPTTPLPELASSVEPFAPEALAPSDISPQLLLQTPTVASLDTQPVIPSLVALPSRPRRAATQAGSTPGYYRNLSGVHFTMLVVCITRKPLPSTGKS
jgi:hypothetical protein